MLHQGLLKPEEVTIFTALTQYISAILRIKSFCAQTSYITVASDSISLLRKQMIVLNDPPSSTISHK